MRAFVPRLSIIALFALGQSCGDGQILPATDAGPAGSSQDATSRPEDARVARDAGGPADFGISNEDGSVADTGATVDAAAEPDAAMPDAALPGMDASTSTASDAGAGDASVRTDGGGSTAGDAGPGPSDIGTPTADAQADAGSSSAMDGSAAADAAAPLDAGSIIDVGFPGDAGMTVADATSGSDATSAGDAAGADGGASGADAMGGTADASGGDATVADGGVDGGSLGVPLSDFCMGQGSVVTVGDGTSTLCAGQIASDAFKFGICACSELLANSVLEVDAFDSNAGPYSMSNVLDDGNIGINGSGLNMSGRLLARGSVFASGGGFSVGPTSEVSRNVYALGSAIQVNSRTVIGRNAFIDGDVVGRFEIVGDLQLPPLASIDPATRVNGSVIRNAIPVRTPCPCSPQQRLNVGSFTGWGSTNNDNSTVPGFSATAWETGGPGLIHLPCGRFYITRIAQQGTLTIRTHERTVLFVDGDLSAGSGIEIDVGSTGELDLFIAGSLQIQGAAVIGSTVAPALFRMYVGGSGSIDLSSSTRFGGNLYAPTAQVLMSANARIHGAMIVDRINFPASAEVHFDTAIRSEGDDCRMPDAGVPDGGGFDGGAPGDASNTPDAGTTLDAGSPSDSGPSDAGTAPDAAAGDSGAPTQDAGTTSPDAGSPTGCTQCSDCMPQACIIPPGQVFGMCAPCVVDTDCCFPAVCDQGICRVLL